jgi:hypothetical protein
LLEHALPEFTGSVIEVASERWAWGVPKREAKRIKDHVEAIKILKECGLNGASIIRAYHQRRVALLMARMLPLHRMVPGASLEGTVLTEAPIAFSEIAQHIKDMMYSQEGSMGATLDYSFLVPGCPPMLLKPSFVEFVSSHSFRLPSLSVPLILTAPAWDDVSRGISC